MSSVSILQVKVFVYDRAPLRPVHVCVFFVLFCLSFLIQCTSQLIFTPRFICWVKYKKREEEQGSKSLSSLLFEPISSLLPKRLPHFFSLLPTFSPYFSLLPTFFWAISPSSLFCSSSPSKFSFKNMNYFKYENISALVTTSCPS